MTDCQQHLSLTMKAEDAADKTKKCDYLFCTENMIWIFDLSHLLLDLSQGLQAKTKDKTIREAAGGGHLHDDIDSLLQLHYLPPLYATPALFPVSFLLFSTSHCYEIVINSVVPGVDLITSSVMAQII
jgi:hypothetical protein